MEGGKPGEPLPTDPRPPRLQPPPPAPLAAGTTVGRFTIRGLLGIGGMGAVYRARDPQLGRDVALKLLRPDRAAAGETHDRLLREAQAAARLSHPHVVAIYEAGSHGDQIYLAMELVDGRTLRAWQAEPGRNWRAIVAAYAGAGRGLAAAHRAGLVHRDFKPDNVLVGADGRARITDFGLAAADEQAVPDTSGTAAIESPLLSADGALIGTPAYMAPEQLAHRAAGPAADQFGFCVSLYEALFGVRPFAGDDVAQLRRRIGDGPAPPPAGSPVPARVRALLQRGLAAEPSALSSGDSMAAVPL
ncbi:MAG TPA: serine/threonine-protein kinase, partial [Kofleriaceae bacterium]|nr:serine/threonine-protein kinase [Kofleriaceae bacterium]